MSKKDRQIEYKPEPDKTDWVQLKTRAPRPLRSKLKIEAATLDESLESYLLALWDMRMDNYRKLLAQKELRESKKNKQK